LISSQATNSCTRQLRTFLQPTSNNTFQPQNTTMATCRRSKRLQQLTEIRSPARRSTSASAPITPLALHPETTIAVPIRLPSPTASRCFFARLCPELLITIWHLTFPIDRIIEVKFPRDSQSLSHQFISREHPVALRLCRHSRTEALKHYALFSTLGSLNKIYLDFENDMLHVRTISLPI
jgi:hypothetical protein